MKSQFLDDPVELGVMWGLWGLGTSEADKIIWSSLVSISMKYIDPHRKEW